MDKKDNAENLEQRVNPYAAPCGETKEIEDLHASLVNCDRLKCFYRGLGLGIFVVSMAGTDLAAMTGKYELVKFSYNNPMTIMVLAGVAALACVLKAEKYKWKAWLWWSMSAR